MAHQADLVAIGVSVGLALGILLAALLFFGIRWYRKHANLRRCSNERSVTVLPIRTNGFDTSTDFSATLTNSTAVTLPEHHPKSSSKSWWSLHSKDFFASASGLPKYSYRDVQKATESFTTIVGEGSFGPVYKATLPAGVAAVKVLASTSHQGEKEFFTEVCLLGRLHHRNLVNLVGYCVDKGKRMLIYEFMSNGSLASILYSEEGRVLDWEERLQIVLDISHGIEYLHEGAVPPVIHRDLKSANILLDESMRAKVADFGLSKEEVFDGRNSGLKGTYGYIDPEYILTNKFTMKSDIYSFGVIIFELITAIHPHQNLMEYVNLAGMSHDGVDEILDNQLIGKCNIEEVRELAKIGQRCLHKTPRKRPSIGEVTQAVLKIKQRRVRKEDSMSLVEGDFSVIMNRIQDQNIELTKLASLRE